MAGECSREGCTRQREAPGYCRLLTSTPPWAPPWLSAGAAARGLAEHEPFFEPFEIECSVWGAARGGPSSDSGDACLSSYKFYFLKPHERDGSHGGPYEVHCLYRASTRVHLLAWLSDALMIRACVLVVSMLRVRTLVPVETSPVATSTSTRCVYCTSRTTRTCWKRRAMYHWPRS